VIKEFQGEFRFLSNFWLIDDSTTVEHEFQASKFLTPALRDLIRSQSSPGKAKRKAHELAQSVRKDWHDVSLQIMEELLRWKFSKPELRERLLATNNEELQEGNAWHDTFWGVDLTTGRGENHLGKLLMKIRQEIRDERESTCIVPDEINRCD
jgi:ribA/ribD-fused uncharacterized protein